MGINLATQKFREDLASLMNDCGLPLCIICSVLNEAKVTADTALQLAIQSELQQEQK